LPLLLAFDTAARQGTFAAAAVELSVTPSAVSHRIRALERLIGETLFVRGGKRLQLTVSGASYLLQVRDALTQLARLSRPRLGDRRRERLRVVAPPTFARELLVPRLPRFMALYPDVALHVSLGVPFSEVKTGQTDVEVRFGDGRGAQAGKRLFAETVFPVASPASARQLAPRGMPPVARIAQATLLRSPRESWRGWFAAAGMEVSEPESGPSFHDLGLVLAAAAADLGIALARSVLARSWLAAGSLQRLSSVEVASPNAYYVHAEAPERPLARAFVDWLCSEAWESA
jgi:DNA-binding transcriptional LysR family regulator